MSTCGQVEYTKEYARWIERVPGVVVGISALETVRELQGEDPQCFVPAAAGLFFGFGFSSLPSIIIFCGPTCFRVLNFQPSEVLTSELCRSRTISMMWDCPLGPLSPRVSTKG